jgi:predicted phage-related endonuclease
VSYIQITSPEQWHELRLKHVGGSEVAALFNACSYLTSLELYLIKRGEAPAGIEDNERMFWGRMVEDAVAQGVAQVKGWVIENPKAYYICDDTRGMGCTPDRFICDAKDRPLGLLQIKNVDRLIFSKWENGEPPLQYQLQLQHELACTGLTWGALAVLVGGNELKICEYQAHAGAIARIKEAITKFWHMVDNAIQPPAVADDYEILKELRPADEHRIIDLSHDNEFPELCATAIEASERRKEAEKQERAAKAAILQKIGDAGRATCSGFTVKKTTVSKKEYLVKATTYQTLTIKEDIVS